MKSIAFIDTEIEPRSHKVLDIGSIKHDGSTFRSGSTVAFANFLRGTAFVCGHNIFGHDLNYIRQPLADAGVNPENSVDTLFLSPLLFPTRPYHALLKDDKLQSDDTNNPLNDSIKAQDLFWEEVEAFKKTDSGLKQLLYLLLKDQKEFRAFFDYVGYSCPNPGLATMIRSKFHMTICQHADLTLSIAQHPIELAYSLALIHCADRYSITPPWVLRNFPQVERIMHLLRNKPCLESCTYCNQALDVHKGLQRYFGFDTYRTYAGEPLQERAVQAAVDNKSILAVFPTGGGKSITFQVPALMSGENAKGLTVVISPLQSLMKDQVDNLERAGITEAVTINGLLDPIERAKSYERVEDGSASLLYISPESLRSKTIERLLLGRNIVRFVIDEAHCFSSWGQDFRVDYLYIGDFIQQLQISKNLSDGIPVSCFTATAKQKVIQDICAYFKEKLSLTLEVFTSKATRTNLQYKVFEKGNEEEKYNAVRNLIDEKKCPTIVYVSRTRRAYLLAERLTKDGYQAKPYHGKMDKQEKMENQDAFVRGEVQIMVATSAFGMGVDKKDIGMVIHYEISDSLENYMQEAGRAGRDEHTTADCYVLFNEEDLSKHFILLNQTKLNIKEIQQVWQAIKKLTKLRATVSNSALEIAREAGWDDSVVDIETRVTTAIAALESAGYLKRGQNMPRVFANSILSKTAQEAIDKIMASERFDEKQKEKAVRIIKKLFSSKSRKQSSDEQAESRVDYISDYLGIVKEEVIKIINLLREEGILADAKDLTAFIKKGDNRNVSLKVVETYSLLERFLLGLWDEQTKTFRLKELNEEAEQVGCKDVTPNKIRTVINFWAIKNWIKQQKQVYAPNHLVVRCTQPKATLFEKMEKRHALSRFLVEYLYDKSNSIQSTDNKNEVLVEFSIHELKAAYEHHLALFKQEVSTEDIEDTLFYLSRINAIKMEGGFLVVYNRLSVERLEADKNIRYKNEHYQQLSQFYKNKVQQIHIMGEYAKKMIEDYKGALQFADDYFQLNYSSFLNKYFKGSREDEINMNLTPAKFRQLFGELSPTQLKIINDKESANIAVAAGPGSGKTKVLVHKLASLLLIEDVKHEQLLMLTFSRAAATEFKKRLLLLIGNAANYIEVKTFHSYCFDLLGKVGNLEKSDAILKEAIAKIKSEDVEPSRVVKTVLVIDEAQDMDADEFALVTTLMEQNDDMRVIAVGDDDQNIYEFRGANSKYLEEFIEKNKATCYELVENYRSKHNLVQFTNELVVRIGHRLKNTPIIAKQTDDGTIRLVKHTTQNLILPLVNDLLTTSLTGTTCVLTTTNEEALQVTGLLLKNGMHAKLIQSNEGFSLYNLLEVRFFLNELQSVDFVISDDIWADAKKKLTSEFRQSSRIEICNNIIRDFEATNTKKKYKSDLEVFIRESKLEDFLNENGETIFVSTIHKAKGKEFNNVFLLLNNFQSATDEAKRQLYVAMTRAKEQLIIHTNGNYLDTIQVDNMEWINDAEQYPPLREQLLHLTYKDVWLDYFIDRQHLVARLKSGQTLTIHDDECRVSGQSVLKFSKQFLRTVETMSQKGFQLKYAKVNFILYWTKENTEQEIRIILPEVCFERQGETCFKE